MIRGSLYIISAPSGTGKTSLVKALLESLEKIRVSISHTTRPKRSAEMDGVNYYFVTPTEFRRMISEELFLEHALVYDHYYGTSRQWVEDTLAQGTDVILEIDCQGALQVKSLFPKSISIFILPPNKETLRKRLEGRGQDAPAVIEKRLIEAAQEVHHSHHYDYVVVNDQFEIALSDLRSIVRAEHCRAAVQMKRQAKVIEALG